MQEGKKKNNTLDTIYHPLILKTWKRKLSSQLNKEHIQKTLWLKSYKEKLDVLPITKYKTNMSVFITSIQYHTGNIS